VILREYVFVADVVFDWVSEASTDSLACASTGPTSIDAPTEMANVVVPEYPRVTDRVPPGPFLNVGTPLKRVRTGDELVIVYRV